MSDALDVVVIGEAIHEAALAVDKKAIDAINR